MGYSSRIMAESWESNSLYWAALADELSVSPTQLNVRIPEWTRKLVEQIFASHLEDWPAVLKSLRVVGDDVRSAHACPGNRTESSTAIVRIHPGKTIMTISRRGFLGMTAAGAVLRAQDADSAPSSVSRSIWWCSVFR